MLGEFHPLSPETSECLPPSHYPHCLMTKQSCWIIERQQAHGMCTGPTNIEGCYPLMAKECQLTWHNACVIVPSELNNSLTTIGGCVDSHPTLDNCQTWPSTRLSYARGIPSPSSTWPSSSSFPIKMTLVTSQWVCKPPPLTTWIYTRGIASPRSTQPPPLSSSVDVVL